jgi:hypothetical protein
VPEIPLGHPVGPNVPLCSVAAGEKSNAVALEHHKAGRLAQYRLNENPSTSRWYSGDFTTSSTTKQTQT